MLNKYHILTVTHKQTALKNIKSYILPETEESEIRERLASLKSTFELDELFYLATCNRVQYLFYRSQPLDDQFTQQFFTAVNPQIKLEAIEQAQHFQGVEAVRHLFQVGASIDSLVVGEREILRQFREAYSTNQKRGLTGDFIRLLNNATVQAAKEIYSKTRIGEKPVSVVSLAIQQLMQTGIEKDARILLVGAGQTNQLVGKFLKKYQFSNVAVFNRTMPNGLQLAEMVNGEAFTLQQLQEYKAGFDALIVCTGATQPILNAALLQQMAGGILNGQVVIDLSIPHNVDDEAAGLDTLEYIDIESLKVKAKENLHFRKQEIVKAKQLLEEHVETFHDLFQQRQIERAMSHVPAEIKALKQHTLDNVFRKEVEELDHPTRELVERMLSYMEKKCIGIPMKAAKTVALQ
jgi:glutamyl-tRNA reductase